MGKEVFESRGLGGREELVEYIKIKAGELDDLLKQITTYPSQVVPTGNSGGSGGAEVAHRTRPGECLRLTAMARSSLETSVMQAVKAISRGQ